MTVTTSQRPPVLEQAPLTLESVMNPFRTHYHHTSDGRKCVQTRDYGTGERTVRTVDRKNGATTGFSRSHWTKKK